MPDFAAIAPPEAYEGYTEVKQSTGRGGDNTNRVFCPFLWKSYDGANQTAMRVPAKQPAIIHREMAQHTRLNHNFGLLLSGGSGQELEGE